MSNYQDQLDMALVRSKFPALSKDWAFFDNAGGSQTLQGAIDRVVEFLTHRDVQIGGSYEISQMAAEALMDGRIAAQTLVNAARPEEIVFGPSTTVLAQTLAAAMRSQFVPGDEIIVTHADHESNIGPWERLREIGVVIKVWPFHRETMRLRLEDLEPLMGPRTKLVCVHHVSNILGYVNPVEDIARFVHDRGALICVDAVAYAPHRAIDVQAWDVDYYIFSLYKCYGPHMAIMYGKYDLLAGLDGLYHYFYGKDKVPGKLEPGNPNYELAYSTTAVVDYIQSLAPNAAQRDARAALEAGFEQIAMQERVLTDKLLDWLRSRNDCRIIGDDSNPDNMRVPTIAFRFDGRNSGEVARAMDDYKVAIRFGDFHSRRLAELLDQTHDGGVLRVSMVHYNTVAEIDRLTSALTRILGQEMAA
ncbi:cysteine desulfurase-like protein [Paracoccus sp. MBLB3053]|uniref:Cysteine desulfurase-like protein n=1 Tax=Paracoccus aurantius TaxID=3073814 RepID=A0ABU2HVU5_9RHOB|nr:cysteine desulfurase-like protein [Paracoccus sp. MBLB3053]MDS9469168.1 cysteine desulfurase-like protein [Paracoccus sp. MBLB3053]